MGRFVIRKHTNGVLGRQGLYFVADTDKSGPDQAAGLPVAIRRTLCQAIRAKAQLEYGYMFVSAKDIEPVTQHQYMRARLAMLRRMGEGGTLFEKVQADVLGYFGFSTWKVTRRAIDLG